MGSTQDIAHETVVSKRGTLTEAKEVAVSQLQLFLVLPIFFGSSFVCDRVEAAMMAQLLDDPADPVEPQPKKKKPEKPAEAKPEKPAEAEPEKPEKPAESEPDKASEGDDDEGHTPGEESDEEAGEPDELICEGPEPPPH